MRTIRICLALVGGIALTGCSGGGGGGRDGEDVVLNPSPETFATLRRDFDALLATYESAPVTPILDMPTSGSATYRGSAVYSSVDTDPNAIIANPTSSSAVEITADFGTDQLGGRLHDFRSSDSNTSIAGELALANGSIQNNTMAADIVGSLRVGGAERDHTGGRILGAFLGSGANAVGGPILQANSPTPYNGSFIAER